MMQAKIISLKVLVAPKDMQVFHIYHRACDGRTVLVVPNVANWVSPYLLVNLEKMLSFETRDYRHVEEWEDMGVLEITL